VGFEPTQASRPSGFQVRRFVLCPVGSSVKECVPVDLQPPPRSTWFLPDVPCEEWLVSNCVCNCAAIVPKSFTRMAAASPGLKPAQDGNRDTGCHGHQIFSAGEEGGTSPGGKEGAFTWMGALPLENWATGKLGSEGGFNAPERTRPMARKRYTERDLPRIVDA